MSIEIKHWATGKVIRVVNAETLQNVDLAGAYLKGADLTGAYLKGADLKDADLTGAYLTGAYLKGAYLEDADLKNAYLKDADLTGAYLTGADLTGADLTGAYLKGADLKDADLTDADLTGAYLTGAYLKGADLTGAYLDPIKHDMWIVLLDAIPEIPALKKAISEGEIDGSTYSTSGCTCLSGTVAKERGLEAGDDLDFADSSRPIERFFMGIKPGDTPETSQFSKLALEWIEEFEGKINLPERVTVGK